MKQKFINSYYTNEKLNLKLNTDHTVWRKKCELLTHKKKSIPFMVNLQLEAIACANMLLFKQ